jgi:large subunit ribosomal protein L21
VYAIIEDSGTQIMVREGDVIDVDLRDIAEGTRTITFPKVIAKGAGDGTPATVGAPYISGSSVTAEIMDAAHKGPKLRLSKYSRRKGYRRTKGSRQEYIRVRIGAIA